MDPFSSASQRRWRLVGAIASFALFAVALVVLWLILRDLEAADVKAAFAAASGRQIALAILCVSFSYLMLTGYDAIGLRQLGRQVRYRITALGSFTSYTP